MCWMTMTGRYPWAVKWVVIDATKKKKTTIENVQVYIIAV